MRLTLKAAATLLTRAGRPAEARALTRPRKARLPAAPSHLEAALELALRVAGFTNIEYRREVRFDPDRKWRIDFLFFQRRVPAHPGGDAATAWRLEVLERSPLAVEVDGGTRWGKSRHSYGQGYDDDCRKLAALTLAGYRVLKVTGTHIESGEAVAWIKEALR